ncbi:hypothetical protein K7X08_031801 [Anisodus acutangulus]|uniref:Uncharacterized protein n=1 Tax=Anisodus acutangulus TaxID=402998 RepID=A0A9Q1MMX0_9SOLA|nr:hypothetical protein K7X08_031801 [Anisodus acutangulus]
MLPSYTRPECSKGRQRRRGAPATKKPIQKWNPKPQETTSLDDSASNQPSVVTEVALVTNELAKVPEKESEQPDKGDTSVSSPTLDLANFPTLNASRVSKAASGSSGVSAKVTKPPDRGKSTS